MTRPSALPTTPASGRAAPVRAPAARLDGGRDGVLREPMYRLDTALSELERALLDTPALRRLHHVAHAGAASLATPYVQSRLQHVLGVFALTARLAPDEPDVRAAALLHDVGHAAFSHSLEGLSGVDHHRWTEEIVGAEPVAGLLRGAGLEPGRVLALAEGDVPSVLKNREGVLHLDHLDSFLRSGRARGTLPLPPRRVVEALVRDGAFVATDAATAELLEALIVEEAELHADVLNLGTGTVLSELAGRLIAAGALALDELPRLVDAELAARLLAHEATREEARRLWLEPQRLRMVRLGPDEPLPTGAYEARKERLYLDAPRVVGRAPDEEGPGAAARRRAEALRGRYAVLWA